MTVPSKRLARSAGGLVALALLGGAIWPLQVWAAESGSAFHPVVPVAPVHRAPSMPSAGQAPAELRIGQGQFFSYALPSGWRVGEDGQFALTLIAPDSKALTVMVGNSGVPLNVHPGQFAYQKLMALNVQNMQMSNPKPATPAVGFAQAYAFDVQYVANGVLCRGAVKVSVAPVYDSAVMAMAAALSTAEQWPGYASWLPQVADQVAATNGAAFGMRGLMQQNLQNSTAYGEAARRYREWSQRTQQQVTDERHRSQDRRNQEFRDTLGAVQPYANPFGANQPVDMPTTYQYYWMNQQEQMLGTNDPGANPNHGSTGEWRRMERAPR